MTRVDPWGSCDLCYHHYGQSGSSGSCLTDGERWAIRANVLAHESGMFGAKFTAYMFNGMDRNTAYRFTDIGIANARQIKDAWTGSPYALSQSYYWDWSLELALATLATTNKKELATLNMVMNELMGASSAGKLLGDTLAFVGAHSVPPSNFHHMQILIFTLPGSEFYNLDAFDNPLKGGSIKYATIGAGEENNRLTGILKSGLNRPRDVKLNIKKDMIFLDVSNEKINNLFADERRFRKNAFVIKYSALGLEKKPDHYNSNSFVLGLLELNDIEPYRDPEQKVPGWDDPVKPIPKNYFGPMR